MNDKQKIIPSLTLEPNNDGTHKTTNFAAITVEKSGETASLKDATMSDDELRMVEEFAEKIELHNSNMITQYGSNAQRKIADFSTTALENVRAKDMGEVGEILSNIVTELKGFYVVNSGGGLFSFLKRKLNNITAIKAKYAKAEAHVDKICQWLEEHQRRLLKDVAFLDKMYELNGVYFKELSMYILAGKKKLTKTRETELPILMEKGRKSGRQEDAQEARDLENLCEKFDKKLHDLELTRIISLQMSPQIRLVQSNNILMSEKIQSTLVNTVPLWKSQMVLAIGIAHSTEATKAQRKVVDMETLKITNETLISAFDEIMLIQKEGRDKRRGAETELFKIEADLKSKLLNLKTINKNV